MRVSLTLPVMPTRSDRTMASGVVQVAIANGVDVSPVNVMAMDYFDPSLSWRRARWATTRSRPPESLHGQLGDAVPERAGAQRWAMVGVTPMIGINDNPAEIFTISDAQQADDVREAEGDRPARDVVGEPRPAVPGPANDDREHMQRRQAVAVRVLGGVPGVRRLAATLRPIFVRPG